MLEEEFKESARITGKTYEDITEYYKLCKDRLTEHYIYTEYQYYQKQEEIREQAISYTRDYVWFDERTIQ